MKETIVYGKTVALALKRGAEELGVDESKAEYEVLEEPKKGFFGVGASDAKLRVYYQPSPAEIAADFVKNLLMNMQVEADVSIEHEDAEGASIAVNGEGLGLLIGRHGDVLDAGAASGRSGGQSRPQRLLPYNGGYRELPCQAGRDAPAACAQNGRKKRSDIAAAIRLSR